MLIFELRHKISSNVLFSNLTPTELEESVLEESRNIHIAIDTLELYRISSSILVETEGNISRPVVLQDILSWSYIEKIRITAFYLKINLRPWLICYIQFLVYFHSLLFIRFEFNFANAKSNRSNMSPWLLKRSKRFLTIWLIPFQMTVSKLLESAHLLIIINFPKLSKPNLSSNTTQSSHPIRPKLTPQQKQGCQSF